MMLDEVNDISVPGDEAADRGKALAERAHDQVDLIRHAEVRRRAPAVPQHAQAVGVIHHDPRAVAPADLDDLRQGGDIAAHAVHAVNHDQLPGGTG